MATCKKFPQKGVKRTGFLIITHYPDDPAIQYTGDLADDYDFLAPNRICQNAIGLFFCLITKRLFNVSFSSLYHRSEKIGWMNLLIHEQRNLKPNINSIEKCFMINRLIAEYTKNPTDFAQNVTKIHEEMQTYMSSKMPSFLTAENLYSAIQTYRNLRYQQRLFHIEQNEIHQSYTLLDFQRATTKLCSQLTARDHFRELLQHSFVIVVQPSTPECVAAAKYEKIGNKYTVKLHSRILCLLDPDIIRTHLTLSTVGITIHSLDRQTDEEGEIQSALSWNIKQILDTNGQSKLFYYAELQNIRLKKLDLRSSRPWYNAKLCQLQFQLKIHINHLNIDEDFTFLSRPFGICSHAQYYPEYVAKVLIYEIAQISETTSHLLQPNTVTDYICHYHTRIAGVKPRLHTKQFIFEQLQAIYDTKKEIANVTSINIYQEIVAKLLSQMEFFVDHPFLSMMYYDKLFQGLCNSATDKELHGTEERLHILLRFDTLAEHQSTQQATIRFIVHNGTLIKATFHTKVFVDEMCRMICESKSEKAKVSRIYMNRSFYDFSRYFDNELYRLSSITPSTQEGYQPVIPVLWSTMRAMHDDQTKRLLSSLSSDVESTISCISSANQNISSSNSSISLHEKIALQTDKLIQYLTEKHPEMFTKLQTENSTSSSVTSEDIVEQNKHLLSNLFRDYLETMSQVIRDEKNPTESYVSYCSTSTNT